MQNTVYNDNEKQFYIPRPDYKLAEHGCIIKEYFPVDIRTGKMANIRLTIEKAVQQYNSFNSKNIVDGKVVWKIDKKPRWTLYFKEKYFYTIKDGSSTHQEIWSLPLALNPTNRKTIMSVTKLLDLTKLAGYNIELFYDESIPLGKEIVGGIRIARITPPVTDNITITQEQVLELQNLCKNAGKDESETCTQLRIQALKDLPAEKFEGIKQRLIEIITKKRNEEQQENQ